MKYQLKLEVSEIHNGGLIAYLCNKNMFNTKHISFHTDEKNKLQLSLKECRKLIRIIKNPTLHFFDDNKYIIEEYK